MNLSIRRITVAGLLVCGFMAAACTADDDDAADEGTLASLVFPGTTLPGTSVAGSTTVATTAPAAPATTAAQPAPTTTVTPTTASLPAAPTTTNPACGEPVGDTSTASESFDAEEGPATNTGLIGMEAELGDHICFERFVITLQTNPGAPDEGSDPGWRVGYDPNFKVCHDREGQNPEVPGTHFICINIGSMVVTVPDNGGLPEAMRLLIDSDEDLIMGAGWVESDDGQSTFLVGLNGEHGFRVDDTLRNPYRLYIDVGLKNPGD